jgi:hypothetical protein
MSACARVRVLAFVLACARARVRVPVHARSRVRSCCLRAGAGPCMSCRRRKQAGERVNSARGPALAGSFCVASTTLLSKLRRRHLASSPPGPPCGSGLASFIGAIPLTIRNRAEVGVGAVGAGSRAADDGARGPADAESKLVSRCACLHKALREPPGRADAHGARAQRGGPGGVWEGEGEGGGGGCAGANLRRNFLDARVCGSQCLLVIVKINLRLA